MLECSGGEGTQGRGGGTDIGLARKSLSSGVLVADRVGFGNRSPSVPAASRQASSDGRRRGVRRRHATQEDL